MVRIEPVALLEYPRARNGMVNTAMFVVCFFEELVKVVVFRHVALDKGDGRAEFPSGCSIDIAEDDRCAMSCQESNRRRPYAC